MWRSVGIGTLLGLAVSASATVDVCDGYGPLTEGGSLLAGDWRIGGSARRDGVGQSSAVLDLDGDGHLDLAIGAPGLSVNGTRSGGVAVFLGPIDPATPRRIADADLLLAGPGPGMQAGVSVASAGDLDFDGRDDLWIGSDALSSAAFPQGVVWLYAGRAAPVGLVNLNQGSAILPGPAVGIGFGTAVAAAGDVNGDGEGDVIVGAPDAGAGGAAFVYFGPFGGLAGAPGLTLTGEVAADRAGVAVVSAGDLDGDGLSDLVVGAPQHDQGGTNAGAAYIVLGGRTGTVPLASADGKLHGVSGSRAGATLAATSDGLWIGGKQFGAGKRGAVWWVDADLLTGASALEEVYDARLRGLDGNDLLGSALAVGDFDADGVEDLLVGAERSDSGAVQQTGGAWVVHGPFSGDAVVSATAGRYVGPTAGGFAGAAVAAGDLNGDGFDDAVVGSPDATVGGLPSAGVGVVLLGGHDVIDVASWHADDDGDGWGDVNDVVAACVAPPGRIARGGDCDDEVPSIHPYAPESGCADPVDRNCDGSVGAVDSDGDGFTACGGDCDDGDAAVSPDGVELCGDDVDNDCVGGADDAGAVDASDWRNDADGDGYGDESLFIRACEAPPIFILTPIAVGGDCDDSNAAIRPGAVEVCDTFDNDCNGVADGPDALDAFVTWPDADGDGAGDRRYPLRACAIAPGRTTDDSDCADDRPGTRPGAYEICNGEDDDCSGSRYLGGVMTASSAQRWTSGVAGFGERVLILPDVTGDGLPDVAVSAPDGSAGVPNGGVVYVLAGPPVGEAIDLALHRADGSPRWVARVGGVRSGGRFGAALAAGDLDGDGHTDLIVGAPNASVPAVNQGAVYVVRGPLSGELAPSVAWTGVDGDDRFGAELATADLDADGQIDLLIGAPREDGAGTRRGAVRLVRGGGTYVSGAIGPATAAVLRGLVDHDQLGVAIAVGDLDGNGTADLAAAGSAAGSLAEGLVAVHLGGGAWSGGLNVDRSLRGSGANDNLGLSLATGDLDGDGAAELVAGARGQVRVLRVGGGITVATRASAAVGASLGAGVRTGDLNADGYDDLVVPAPGVERLYVVYGTPTLPATVDLRTLESFGRFTMGISYRAQDLGVPEGAQVGGVGALRSVAVGDLDGDTTADLLLGASGEVQVVLAGPYGLDLVERSASTGWNHGLTVDGDQWDWVPGIEVPGGGGAWTVTWSDDELFLGSSRFDVAFGDHRHFIVAYLGDQDGVGAHVGMSFNTQHPGLPFAADYAVVWRADDAFAALATWNGAAWVLNTTFFDTQGHRQERNDTGTVEFQIPFSAIGSAERFDLVAWWLFEGEGFETSYAALPDGAFVEGAYDPDPATFHRFDRYVSLSPFAQAVGEGRILEDAVSWYADADGDSYGAPGVQGPTCSIHLPRSHAAPGAPTPRYTLDPARAIDCDDGDAAVRPGATEVAGDGIDSDCDGQDAPSDARPVATACALTPASPTSTQTLSVSAAGSDPNGDPITWAYVWTKNGAVDVDVTGTIYPHARTSRGDVIGVSCVPSDAGGPGTAAVGGPITIGNALPVASTCTISPSEVYVGESMTASATGTDPDGDVVGFTYAWTVDGASAGAGSTLGPQAAGRVVGLSCTPGDGIGAGVPLAAPTVTVRNEAPVVTTVAITPSAPSRATGAVCGWTGTDAEGNALSASISWTVNGTPAGTGAGLAGTSYTAGSVLRCTVVLSDGFSSSAPMTSDPVTASNATPTAPVVELSPADPLDTEDLRCVVVSPGADADPGDTLSTTIAWKRDGVTWLGARSTTSVTGDTIAADDLSVGVWSCEVFVSDGAATSPVATGAAFVNRGLRPVVLRSGGTHTCAVLDDASLKCWGANESGQLGLGSTTQLGDAGGEMGDALATVSLPAGITPVSLALGTRHTCALFDDDSVRCWGSGALGQTGGGGTANVGDGAGEMGADLAAVNLGTVEAVVELEAGLDHTCARFRDGRVKCWGSGAEGRLGSGGTAHLGDGPGEMGDALPFVALGVGRRAVDLTAGDAHTCALLDNGSVKCWGRNTWGQLGQGDQIARGDGPSEMGDSLPAVSLGLGVVVDTIDAGNDHTCARFTDGRVKCWGRNDGGFLGLGDVNPRGDTAGEMGNALPFVSLGTGRTATQVAAGSGHACALLDNGTLKCWGSGGDGRLGYGDFVARGDGAGEMGDALAAVALPGGVSAQVIDLGFKTTCAVTDCGRLHCWGDNVDGRLGLGTATDLTAPTAAVNLGTSRLVDVDRGATCAWEHTITIDGDPSDWVAAEGFVTSQGGATRTWVTWDDTYVYFGATNPDVQSGGSLHWFVVYVGDNTFAGTRDGITHNTQAPYLAAPVQTAARWKADNSFNSLLVGSSGSWFGFSNYLTSGTNGAALAENNGSQFVEMRLSRADLGLDDRMIVQAHWVYEGSGFESSYAATPSNAHGQGVYDPAFASYLRFELDHPDGPGAASVRAALP